MLADLRCALRQCAKNPGFALFVVLTLAMGIGATTAMFSVINGVLLRPLALPDPGQLVLVGESIPQMPAQSAKLAYIVNPVAYRAWRDHATDFSGLALLHSASFILANAGLPQLLHGANITPNLFSILGVTPQLGRGLIEADATATNHPIVITDALWRSAFGADPGVIGRSIGVPAASATIVGVLPASFRLEGRAFGPMLGGEPTQYFGAALGAAYIATQDDPFSDFNFSVIGRLRPGVTLGQARAQLDVLDANLARDAHAQLSLSSLVSNLQDYAVAASRQELWLLLGGVGAVLLIICVNLGGLAAARVADRKREWAIRAAMGAAPGRLARQVLAESVLLGLVGGSLGIVCAALSLRTLLAAAPGNIPRLGEVQLDWRVLAFGLVLSVLAGLLTGMIPALRMDRSDPQSVLKAAGGAATADRSSLRSRQSLIALQAALSTLLLAATALIGLSFYHLVSQDVGFVPQHALAASVALNAYHDGQREAILRGLPDAARAVSGVTDAAVTSWLPLDGEIWVDSLGAPGLTWPAAQRPMTNVRFVGPGYFRAVGVPLLAGRDLAESDRPANWPPKSAADESSMHEVVVVSLTAVHLLWPGISPEQALGRAILFNGKSTPMIVGVAADARTSLRAATPAVTYQPYWTQPPYHFSLVVRSALPAATLAAPLRAAIWKIAPDAPVPTVKPLADLESDAVAPQRYQLTLLLLFAGLALLLAALGVYALVAHSVARRSRELAIRIALGAGGGIIWRMVVRQALAPVLAGVMAGLVGDLAAGRVLASFLFQTAPTSPGVLAVAAIAVLLAALAACLAPARRATRVDPLIALRAE
jgi:predicted permease